MNETSFGKSAFTEVLGDTPRNRVWQFLISSRGMDYTKTQVADCTETSRLAVFKVWKDFIRFNIIKKTRTMGKGDYFILDLDNPIVQHMIKIYKVILNQTLEQGEKIAQPISVGAPHV